MVDLKAVFGELGFPLGPIVDEARKGHPEKALEALALLGELAEAGLLSEPQAMLLGSVLRRLGKGENPKTVFMDPQKAKRGAKTGRQVVSTEQLLAVEEHYEKMRSEGLGVEDAKSRTSRKFHCSVATVERYLKQLREARLAE